MAHASLATQVSQLASNLSVWSDAYKDPTPFERHAALLPNGNGSDSAYPSQRSTANNNGAELMRARTEAAFWRDKAELLQRELFREKLEAAHMREAELGMSSALRELQRQVEACCAALGTASGAVAYDLNSGPHHGEGEGQGGLASVSAVQELSRAMHWAASTAKRLPQTSLEGSGSSSASRAPPQQGGPQAHSIRVDDKSFCSPRNSLSDAVVASEMEDVAGPMLGSSMLQRRASVHRRSNSAGSWGSLEEATQAMGGMGGLVSPPSGAAPLLHASSFESTRSLAAVSEIETGRGHLEHTFSSPESIASLLEEGVADQYRSTPPPFTPASFPRHRRSISANPTSDGPAKTSLTKLIVSGAAMNGVSLTAKGVQRGGKRCLFQWSVLPQGASEWQPVRSARRPELRTTLADIGAKFRCDATPVADDGSHGALCSAYSQPIVLNELSGVDVKQSRRRDGSFRFLVGLKDNESGGDMRAVLVLSQREFSVHVVGRDMEEECVRGDGALGARILCTPLPDPEVGKSARPHVVMVVERSSACFKLGASRRGQLLEAVSPEEQERIGIAVKMLYPSALLLPNDYRSTELSLISPRPSKSSPQHTQERGVMGVDVNSGDGSMGQQHTSAYAGPRKVHSIPPSEVSPGKDTRDQPLMWSPKGASTTAVSQRAVPPQSTKKATPSSATPSPAPTATTTNHTPSPRTPVLHPQGRGQLSAGDLDLLSADVAINRSGDLSPDSLDGAWRRVQSASGGGRGRMAHPTGNYSAADFRSGPPLEHDRLAELQQRDASGSSGQSFTDGGSQRTTSVGRTVSAMTLEESSSPGAMTKAKSDNFGMAAHPTGLRVNRQSEPQVSPASSRHSTRHSTDYGSALLPTINSLHLEGAPLVGSTISARGYTIEPVFQWQRISTLGRGSSAAEGPTHPASTSTSAARQGSLEVQSIPGATGASYQITPDDLHAIIRVCCIPQDASGLKGLTTYACLTESKPVELPPDLDSEITTYKNLGTANFQVKRGGATSDTITLHLDTKACYLKSKSGRVLTKEKYLPGSINVRIPLQPGKATVAITRPATSKPVTWELMFKSQHERDAAVLLIRSFGDSLREASQRKKGFFSSFSSNGKSAKS